ncbi:MAG: co-chaperone GroES [Candidatus Zixiibacteriota bacterium]
MKLKPLHDRVLVKPEEVEKKTEGGLYIPDTAKKEKPQRGEVVAVGEGQGDTPLKVKEGDKVLFSKFAGNDITIEDVEYLIMRENDILAIIED